MQNKKSNLKSLYILISISALFSFYFLNPPPAGAATESTAIIREDCSLKSIPTANCYNSLFDWEAAENRDLTATDEIAVARIEGPWANPDTTAVTIDGWTTSATDYIKIYTTSEARHDGKWSNAKYRLEITDSTAIDVNENYVRIDGLQVSVNYASANHLHGIDFGISEGNFHVSNSVIRSSGNNDYGNGIRVMSPNSPSVIKIWSNIIYGFNEFESRGIYLNDYYGKLTAYIYNNTIYNSNEGILLGSGPPTVIAKNNLVSNSIKTDFDGVFASGSTSNASSDATAPGTNSLINQTFLFTDAANNDFHLASGSPGIDQGANLSSDANLAFSDDIDGESRPVGADWDIGADESGGTAPTPDTQAPTTPTNLSATAISSSQINLSWTASTDDTAVSGYRIYRNGTELTTITQTSYSDTGLSPETTYTYTVSAYDSSSNESSQSTAASATTQQNTTTFDYVMGTANYGHSTIPEPAQWESYTDPFFNTTIRRITDISDISGATNIKLSYGRRSYVSSDNRYLLVYATGAGGNPYYIYDLKNRTVRAAPHITGKVYYGNGGIDAQPEYLWDHSGNYPTRIYYRYGLKFYQADINYPDGQPDDPNSNILLHDFANEYPNAQVAYNAEKGDSSVDSRYWAFIIRNGAPGYGVEAIITYDKETDTIIGELKNPPLPSWVGMSPDAQYVILANRWKQGGQGSNFDGPHSWKRDFSGTPVKVARDARHNGGGFDINGNFMFLQMNDSNCRNDNLCATDVADGVPEMSIINQSDFEWAGYHLGWHYGSEQRGWILMELYDQDETKWGANQIIMVEIKPKSENPRIWRVAHSQDHYTGYASALMSSISQDGTRIYFNSNWHGTDNIEIYEVTLPANWWNDLNGTTSPPTDTTSPVISNVTTLNITSNTATISWTTDEPADSRIEYGPTTSYGTATNLDQALTISHSRTITNLSPGTIYHFRVESSDSSSNNSVSPDNTFTTKGGADTTPPSRIMNLSITLNRTTGDGQNIAVSE